VGYLRQNGEFIVVDLTTLEERIALTHWPLPMSCGVWSMTPDGEDLRQHTFHDDYDVLGPEIAPGTGAASGRIVYQHGADLRLFDPRTGADRALEIRLRSDFDQTREKWIDDPAAYITDMEIDQDGSHVVITARGEVFVVPVGPGRRVRVTRAPDVRYRRASFLPDPDVDGGTLPRVIAQSDEATPEDEGIWAEIEFWSLPGDGIGPRERLTSGHDVLLWSYAVSPDGTMIAYTDKDFILRTWNLETDEVTEVDRSEYFIDEITWAPDSRRLAYTVALPTELGQIRIHDLETGDTAPATTERWNAYAPTWHPSGDWLLFLTDRELRSLVGSPWGLWQPEPHFDRTTLVHAVALRPDVEWPWRTPTELDATSNEDDDGKGEDDADHDDTSGTDESDGETEDDVDGPNESGPEPIEVVLEGLVDRLYEVPLGAGNYFALTSTAEHLYLLSRPDPHDPTLHLLAFPVDHDDPEPTTIASGVNGYRMSGDRSKLLVRQGGRAFVVPANGSAATLDDDSSLDLAGWSFSLEPREEWRQMFVDAWRLLRDYFYDRDLHGVDWPAVLERYLPLVDRIADRHELSDLLAQMTGELAALHHFVYGGDRRTAPQRIAQASLGARYERDEATGGFRITTIYRHDPDFPDEAAPLRAPDVDAAVGDVITMIDGVDAADLPHPHAALRGLVGRQVRLRLVDGETGAERDVIVEPISPGAESSLRYRQWELERADRVAEATEGRVGYIHLRAMGGGNISEWYRDYQHLWRKEGLVIDVRRNNGGNIDSWILSRLIREAWMFWNHRGVSAPAWNMQQAFRGHLVILVDHRTSSDGETVAEGFRRLGLGPIIGTRTWGGGIWLTSSNYLVDGGIATAGEFGVYGPEGAWIIEGPGVTPDVIVDNLPHATYLGEDAQLEAAIEHLLERIAEEPVVVPDPPPGKDLSLPAYLRRRGDR